jgi:hypothetical protein
LASNSYARGFGGGNKTPGEESGVFSKPSLLPKVLEHEGFTGKQIAERILGYNTKAVQATIAAQEFSE